LRAGRGQASFPDSNDPTDGREEAMEPAAVVTFVVIAGIVWGGFLLIATKAIKSESRKKGET
jgi:hypothetical protein